MENKRQDGKSSSSSSSSSFDHLFGPRDSSSSSSSGVFGSIFPTPSTVLDRDLHGVVGNQTGSDRHGINSDNQKGKGESSNNGNSGKEKSSTVYQNVKTEPSYLSSSIYYGGQENYTPRTNQSCSEPRHDVKKNDGDDDDDPNGDNPNSASRGNWWQGSLYY